MMAKKKENNGESNGYRVGAVFFVLLITVISLPLGVGDFVSSYNLLSLSCDGFLNCWSFGLLEIMIFCFFVFVFILLIIILLHVSTKIVEVFQ